MNIDELPNASTSLEVENLLERNEFYKSQEIIKTCCSKIGIGNTISFSGTDLYSLCYNYIHGKITEEEMNRELLGKKSLHNLQDIAGFLLHSKFVITKKDIHIGPLRSNYFIEGKRNA